MSESARFNEIIKTWLIKKEQLIGQEVQAVKKMRMETKSIRDVIIDFMRKNGMETYKTETGWLVLKCRSSKPPRNDELLKTVFCEFHKKMHGNAAQESMDAVSTRFVNFVTECQKRIATMKYDLHFTTTEPLQVYLSNMIKQ